MPLDVHDAALLHDMLMAAKRITVYASGRNRSELDSDPMLSDAIIIGEAARGVSDSFRQQHPEIPWRPITTTRHILAHRYGDVNRDTIWRII